MVRELRAVIPYLSYSGNTEEVAVLIADTLTKNNVSNTFHRIGIDMPIDPQANDFIFLGTFTWETGSTPEEVKDFILEVGCKPTHVAVFGTGDTQFGGDDLFCSAVDKLCRFYQSPWDGLKVEQSPRGSQEHLVRQWTEGVLYHAKVFT